MYLNMNFATEIKKLKTEVQKEENLPLKQRFDTRIHWVKNAIFALKLKHVRQNL